MKHRPDSIDLLDLYAKSNNKEWNKWLSACLNTHDVQSLVSAMRRLQAGMDDLVKKKMNTEKICEFFIRLQRSIEITLKKIYRQKNPNPLWNSLNKDLRDKHIYDKNNKNIEFEKFMRRNRF